MVFPHWCRHPNHRFLIHSASDDRELELLGPIYKFAGDVEDPEKYQEGGYQSIRIGVELHHSRYGIAHKLGYGSYSTVWPIRRS